MLRRTILITALTMTLGASESASVPRNWFLAGSDPQDYVATLDRTVFESGKASAALASSAEHPKGFGTLMQMTEPGAFAGKRIRFSARVRSAGVQAWAGLWFRVDGSERRSLAFDNMQDRPIKGDSDWTPCSIVLDVSSEASALAFGILLQGVGKVWIDSATIEVVDRTMPTTGGSPSRNLPAPSNLGFEQ